MFKIVLGAVILTLTMTAAASLTAFVLLVYSRLKDEKEALEFRAKQAEELNKKLSAENFALRLGKK